MQQVEKDTARNWKVMNWHFQFYIKNVAFPVVISAMVSIHTYLCAHTPINSPVRLAGLLYY